MPEGDSLHRAARRLQVLVGDRVEVETPNPRAAVKQLAERLDGRVLESVEAVGKNLLLRFEGGVTLRSHLRMTGRWRVYRRGTVRSSGPWLVLRGREWEAAQWNGPVLTLSGDGSRAAARAGRAGGVVRSGGGCRAGSRGKRCWAAAGGGAARPAAGGRDREHVDGGGGVGGAAVAVAAGRRGDGRGAAGGACGGGAAHGRCPGGRSWRASTARGLSACRHALPALRRGDPLARSGRRQPHGVLVPGLPARAGAAAERGGRAVPLGEPRGGVWTDRRELVTTRHTRLRSSPLGSRRGVEVGGPRRRPRGTWRFRTRPTAQARDAGDAELIA